MDVKSQLRVLGEQTAQASAAPSTSPVSMTVKVAHGFDEMMQAIAVRAAVFLGEQNCPYAEEFDGNDSIATHFLGMVGDEPVCTCRVRYFANFARLERVVVRRGYRSGGVGAKMIGFVYDLCREKGYRKIHGQAEEHLVQFWEKFGFRRTDAPSFAYGGHTYIELVCELDLHPDPIVIGKDPILFVRPEGAWDRPCRSESDGNDLNPESTGVGQNGDVWADELQKHPKRLG